MDKRPPLVVKLSKISGPKLSLSSEQDWKQLKATWLAEFTKKNSLLDVNVIVTKKVREQFVFMFILYLI